MSPRPLGKGPARGARRQNRTRAPRGPALAGREYDVEVGPVAHGGHCVTRLPADAHPVAGTPVAGTVVFVRHALPGELVTVRLTEGFGGDRFLRGDAVVVHRASPDRVTAPCPVAGPGLCGGCDFQHAGLDAQRRLKGQVVAEQLRRLAGVDREVEVEAVPGDTDGLRWRTRMRYHRLPDGGLGLRAHRSNAVVPVEDCLIQAPEARVTVEGEPGPSGPVQETVGPHRFLVDADGFWQGHRGAPAALVEAVLEAAAPAPGERVLDLYSGVGLFAAFCADAVGVTGRVVAVEGDARASSYAELNLADHPWAHCVSGPVEPALDVEIEGDPERGPGEYDVVVLDPPREGAKRAVVDRVAALGPRVVVYVACDPAAFARDVSFFAANGYELSGLRAFDLFPMTHHVEVVGTLHKVP